MPASGILYLRCNDSTPDSHEIVVNTPGGTVSYKIPIVKIKDYSLDDMLSKKLFFLIPFYFSITHLKNGKDHALIEDMKIHILSCGISWNRWFNKAKYRNLKICNQSNV